MSKRLQIITFAIVVSLVGVFFYISGITNPLITQNKIHYQSSEYLHIQLIDEHPHLEFAVDENNVEEMIRALNLTKNGFTFEKFGTIDNGIINTVEVHVTDQIYDQVVYKNPDNNHTYRSSSSVREGNVLLIKLGINDLDYITSSAPVDVNTYLNWLLINDIMVEMSLSIHNKYDDFRNKLDRYGFIVSPQEVSSPIIKDISY